MDIFNLLTDILDIRTVLVLTFVALLIVAYNTTKLPEGFPPGPPRYPFVGNLFLFAANQLWFHKKLYELSKTYGEVFGNSLLGRLGIVITGPDAIKEALITKSSAFSSRPMTFLVDSLWSIKGAVRGVLWQNGSTHKQLRRFSLLALRDFGVGKRSLEARIQEEANALCNAISERNERPTDLADVIQAAVSNVICSICFGNRFDYDNAAFVNLQKRINYNSAKVSLASPLNFVPLMRFLPSQKWFWTLVDYWKEVDDFIVDQIEEHRETFDPKEPRDFVDLYLTKESEGHNDKDTFSSPNLQRTITDLFIAGTETTSTTLRWIILFMLHYPEVQAKCKQEIVKVVGTSRPPSLSDRVQLPFVNATIHEIQRVANTTPFSLPYLTTEDTTLQGYKIPKDTVVLVNLYSCHVDPKYWDQPEKFDPTRWIDQDGLFKKADNYIPFSIGPRACLGEQLAKNEIFLFFATIIQRFKLEKCDTSLPRLEGALGITHSPPEFKVICKNY